MDANVLSDREIEVLRLVGQGKSNKEIAMDLDISVNTVKVHIGRIFQKWSPFLYSEVIFQLKLEELE